MRSLRDRSLRRALQVKPGVGRTTRMRTVAEGFMYLAFTVAALPFAYLGLTTLNFYQAHPELLPSRDAGPEMFGALGGGLVMLGPLLIGGIMALYFLLVGPAELRVMSGTLMGAWVLSVSMNPVRGTDFRSFERLYADAYPFVAMALLPTTCAVARLASAGMISPRAWREWWGEGL